MLKDLSEIGHIVQNAMIFNPHNWKGISMDANSLLQTVRRLFALLEKRQIEYVLVGGIALLNYVEGRNTEDIDLIMASPDLTKLPEITVKSQENPYFARGTFNGLQIDILLTKNPLFRLIQQKYTVEHSFLEQTISMATIEGLLLLKLYALPSLYRQGSFVRVSVYENDIASLLYTYCPDHKALFETLKNYVSDNDMNSLQEIVHEIEQRIQRFQSGRAQ